MECPFLLEYGQMSNPIKRYQILQITIMLPSKAKEQMRVLYSRSVLSPFSAVEKSVDNRGCEIYTIEHFTRKWFLINQMVNRKGTR